MPDLQVPVLESKRLRLEPISRAHSEGMFELWSDAMVCEYSGPAIDSAGLPIDLPARTRSESDRLLAFWLECARVGTGFRWAVVLHDQGEFGGAVGFNSLGLCSEYAYHFVPRFWGRGLATEASRLALSWSFASDAASIESFIEPGNVASIRLVERLGFERSHTPASEVPRYLITPSAAPKSVR